jgi:hypothetical protein
MKKTVDSIWKNSYREKINQKLTFLRWAMIEIKIEIKIKLKL